ncbi:hypothetical protein Lsed01_00860 [Demequina sediminis]|uniref:Uncharacterized protein n=1 Tax=Demequina sediminis TaxID=1930058 RepID=A0ABP9WGT3_9MICO|nr:hypothetical protein [Demequina sediminis]
MAEAEARRENATTAEARHHAWYEAEIARAEAGLRSRTTWRKRDSQRLAAAIEEQRAAMQGWIETPEGLTALGKRYEGVQDGLRQFQFATERRNAKLRAANVDRRFEYMVSQEGVDTLRFRLRDTDNPLTPSQRAYIEGRIVRLESPPADGGSNGFKEVREWDERYTYRKELEGKKAPELHALAVSTLKGETDASEHLLTCIAEKRTTNSATLRMISRGSKNLRVRDKALARLVERDMQVKNIPDRNRPAPLGSDVEQVEPVVSDEDYMTAVEAASKRVLMAKRYRDVDDLSARVQMALQRERTAVARGSVTEEEAVLAQPSRA